MNSTNSGQLRRLWLFLLAPVTGMLWVTRRRWQPSLTDTRDLHVCSFSLIRYLWFEKKAKSAKSTIKSRAQSGVPVLILLTFVLLVICIYTKITNKTSQINYSTIINFFITNIFSMDCLNKWHTAKLLSWKEQTLNKQDNRHNSYCA